MTRLGKAARAADAFGPVRVGTLLDRAEGLRHEELVDHWRTAHAPRARRLPGLVGNGRTEVIASMGDRGSFGTGA